MTANGVSELYLWLTTAWPLVIKPGASEDWTRAKKRELYRTYEKYTDQEVMAAFEKWTLENEKFPTTKNIFNEIIWAKRLQVKDRENETYWPMDFIKSDGSEWSYGNFKRSDFINHPRNLDHLEPEEWERRFKARRKAVLAKVYPIAETPESSRYATLFVEIIKDAKFGGGNVVSVR